MSGLSASVAPGRALATLAGRPGQLGGWTSYYLEGEPKKARGQRQGSNSSHPFSPSTHIAPILAPFVIPASLIPVIPATPLISFNLKGDGCSSSIKGEATKIWRKYKYRVPESSNYEPRTLPSSIGWHVQGLFKLSDTKTRVQFLKSWYMWPFHGLLIWYSDTVIQWHPVKKGAGNGMLWAA